MKKNAMTNSMARQQLTFGKIPLEFGHTCMNNFIVLDCREGKCPTVERLKRIAEIFCVTPMADDLLILKNSNVADVRLHILGADGREADFCGNGMIYVSAKIGEEQKKDSVKIESLSGIKTATKLNKEWKVEIGPAIMLSEELAKVPVATLKGKLVLGLVRAGEPHLVVKNPSNFYEYHMYKKDFEDYCRPLWNITRIEGGVSITMVFENVDKKLLIRTFERGVRRQTFSCGTGSVSAAAALFGIPSHKCVFEVCSPGGRQKVVYEKDQWYLVAAPQRTGKGYLENSVMHLPLSGLSSYEA